MKYFSNYEADSVVREDDDGNRYIKTIDNLNESRVKKGYPEAYGIPSFGIHNFLRPITREEYETFGVKWYWSPYTGEKVILDVQPQI